MMDTAIQRDDRQHDEPNRLIETKALTKRYGHKRVAVKDLDLTVYKGEVYGFLGPNGAGKTTTLRMLLGLIRPSSGSAEILGGEPGAPESLPRVGSLVESPAFYPYLSGWDNLDAAARLSLVESPKSRVREALEQVGLSERGGDKFNTYSLGMKQRLSIAAALVKDPELLILDEPTNGLDARGMAEVRELIRELGGDGRTVLLSSHLMNEVEQVCNQVGIISKGELVKEGRIDDLRGAEELLLRTEFAEEATRKAQRLPEVKKAEIVSEDQVRLLAGHEAAPEIVRSLVAGGVAVGELRRETLVGGRFPQTYPRSTGGGKLNVAASFVVELKKLRKRPATWVLTLTFVVLMVLFSYVFSYASIYFIDGGGAGQGAAESAQSSPSYASLYPDNVAASVLPLFSGVGTAMTLILGTLCMGSEYRWDTFKFSLTQGPGRISFLVGKTLAVGAVTAILCLLTLLIGLSLSYLVLIIQGGPAQWPPLWELLKAFGAGWLSLAAFACLGVFLAILFRGTGAAISLGLVYIFAFEGILSGVLLQNSTMAKIIPALPGKNAADMVNAFGPSSQGVPKGSMLGLQSVGPLQAALVLATYILAFLLMAALIFKKRDLA